MSESTHNRQLAEKIVKRLEEAGLAVPWPSHQFGMVNRDKVIELVKGEMRHYEIRLDSKEKNV